MTSPVKSKFPGRTSLLFNVVCAALLTTVAACKDYGCAYKVLTFRGASERFSPAAAEIHLGERFRIDLSMPAKPKVEIDSVNSYEYDIRKFPNEYVLVYLYGPGNAVWTGQTFPQIGAIQNSDLTSSFYLNLVAADSVYIGAIEFLPSDTGVYMIRTDYVSAGDGCTSVAGLAEIQNPDRHFYLADDHSAADSLSYFRSYYFRVVP